MYNSSASPFLNEGASGAPADRSEEARRKEQSEKEQADHFEDNHNSTSEKDKEKGNLSSHEIVRQRSLRKLNSNRRNPEEEKKLEGKEHDSGKGREIKGVEGKFKDRGREGEKGKKSDRSAKAEKVEKSQRDERKNEGAPKKTEEAAGVSAVVGSPKRSVSGFEDDSIEEIDENLTLKDKLGHFNQVIGIQRKSAKDTPFSNGVTSQPARSFQGGALFHVRKAEEEQHAHPNSIPSATGKPGGSRQARLGPQGGSESENRMLSSLVGM